MRSIFLLTMITASAAFAHDGVKDKQVMARMEGMSNIAADMKQLAKVARTAFDPVTVAETGGSLSAHARDIERLFMPQATDPKSEARPKIWTNWDQFLEAAADLEKAALELSQSDETGFAQKFEEVGQTCKSCHKQFRLKK